MGSVAYSPPPPHFVPPAPSPLSPSFTVIEVSFFSFSLFQTVKTISNLQAVQNWAAGQM